MEPIPTLDPITLKISDVMMFWMVGMGVGVLDMVQGKILGFKSQMKIIDIHAQENFLLTKH